MIVYQSKNIEEIGAQIEWAHFTAGGVEEVHAMLHVEPRCELFEGQVARIQQAEKILLGMEDVQGASIVFKRYFLSDATNQVPVIQENDACTPYCFHVGSCLSFNMAYRDGMYGSEEGKE